MSHTNLTVDGMTCEACRTAVREALELPGVRQVAVSLDTGIVDVAHAETVTVEAIVSAIEDTGYEVRRRIPNERHLTRGRGG
jgi:copper chaperone CopZ